MYSSWQQIGNFYHHKAANKRPRIAAACEISIYFVITVRYWKLKDACTSVYDGGIPAFISIKPKCMHASISAAKLVPPNSTLASSFCTWWRHTCMANCSEMCIICFGEFHFLKNMNILIKDGAIIFAN